MSTAHRKARAGADQSGILPAAPDGRLHPIVGLRLAYGGDWPGRPFAWVNGRLLTCDEVEAMLKLFGVAARSTSGLKQLMTNLGAKEINGEHEEWDGCIQITATRNGKPNS